jgi:hypothetical protein
MKLGHIITAFAALLALSFPALRAQSPQGAKQGSGSVKPDSPLPPIDTTQEVQSGQSSAAAPRGSVPAYDSQPYDPAQVEPDTHTLSGGELFSVGSLGKTRTIFDPSLFVSQTGVTGIDRQAKVLSETLVGGALNIDHRWGISRLVGSYNGGETIFFPHDVRNVYYHNLSIEDTIRWSRLTLRIRDDLNVSPYAIFGGQGMGGPGMIGQFNTASQTAVSSTLGSGETIQTGIATRLLDTALGEVDYSLSRNSTISFSGSYGLLHFMSSGFINSKSVNGQVGFDHMLDPKNSIAVIGAYGKTDFGGSANSTRDYIGQLAYGRKMTGKLALQLAAGPEQIQTLNAGSVNFQFLSWSSNVAISYKRRRTDYSLYYTHGLTNGSGVLTGAMSHAFNASVSRSLTRHWFGSARGGYALDRSIPIPSAPTSFSFTNWYSGAYIGRTFDRHVDVNLNYGVQHQRTSNVCPVFVCGGTGYVHTFGTTVNWHLRRTE